MKNCVFCVLLFVTICFAQTEISGEFSGILELSDSPYEIIGDIIVNASDSLVISPGCSICFMGDYQIEIDSGATFISNGSELQPIIFTQRYHPLDEETSRYDGIVMYKPEMLEMSFCVFENAFSESQSILSITYDDTLNIRNCEFSNNSANLTDSTLEFGSILDYTGPFLIVEDCFFYNNSAILSGAINCYGDLSVSSSVFEKNSSLINGGALSVKDYEYCLIEDSRFDRNHSSNGGAIAAILEYRVEGKLFEFKNNICSFNSAINLGGGLYFQRSQDVIISNSVFVGNSSFYGGAMYSATRTYEYFSAFVKNSTFCDNFSYQGNLCYAVNYEKTVFYNSIIYNSYPESNMIFCSSGDLNNCYCYNCLISCIDYEYLGIINTRYCIFDDPLFVEWSMTDSSYDLHLNECSPCIDAGNSICYIEGDSIYHACTSDIDYVSRPSLTGYDIGAYEYPGEFCNLSPEIDCPGDIVIFDCPFDSLLIEVSDLYLDSLFLESSPSFIIVYPDCIPDEFFLYYDGYTDSLHDGRDITLSVSDGEYSDTCRFSILCVPDSVDSGVCEEDTIYLFVGSINDTLEYCINGVTPETLASVYLDDLDEELFVDESFVSTGFHYEYNLVLTANEEKFGDYDCCISFYNNSRFRCINLHVCIRRRQNLAPNFYGCPDSLVLLSPSEISFVYLQVEDVNFDSLIVELSEYPEPYEEFWNFRTEQIGDVYHVYLQFYPSYEDTGMHIFRVRAYDNFEYSECVFYTYVTKDSALLCPYIEPETLYIEYLEGSVSSGKIAFYDPLNIHSWHIETNCDSFLCVFPEFGFGSDTSIITPQCKYNSIEVVFAIDVTGSMGVQLDSIESHLENMVLLADSLMINIKYGLATFRDEAWILDLNPYDSGINLTRNYEVFLDSLDHYSAVGGDDADECLLDALAGSILNYDWSDNAIRMIVAITDASFHYRGDGSIYSRYTPEEIDSYLVRNDIIFSIFELRNTGQSWYDLAPELTGGEHYRCYFDYSLIFEDIEELTYSFDYDDYFSDGTYECNLTYVIDNPINCPSIDIPIVINIVDSTETFTAYNCPLDTIELIAGESDTIGIRVEYVYCDSPYVNLVDYPIDHVDMWRYASRIGYNSTKAMLIFTPEASDSGLYYYRIEYGNEYGSDTCSFFVRVLGQEPFYHFFEGWNLLSYPFTEPNTELITLNPDMVRPYTWNASDYTYELPDEITTADAFWLYSNCEMYNDIHYATISEITTTLYAGWNMVSSTGDTLDIDILTSHPEVVTSVYYYNTNAGEYESATEILPGIGYWLMSTETFEISYPE